MNNDSLKITKKIDIQAKRKHVWDFINDQENMQKWFQADEFIIDIFEGGSIRFSINIDGVDYQIVGEVGLVYPKSKFFFTWLEEGEDGIGWVNNTQVEIVLKAKNQVTQVELTHDGFDRLPANIRTNVYKRYVDYWENSGILDRISELIVQSL